ncbi:unnamed protein product [Didymodactylos carnosus]|uniref:Uncharacterized protein n=1 Tax=Didymodactylos carnosus TaxID=1234261 RepID=A0A815WVR7_9BILA|nr:unnamed protein product [Didymodactylos carnosus]CAF4411400.1 unnamed protein product [Didymodactylos carnosus]
MHLLLLLCYISFVCGKIYQSTIDKDLAEIDRENKALLSINFIKLLTNVTASTCKIADQCCPEKRSLLSSNPEQFLELCLSGPLVSAVTNCSAAGDLINLFAQQTQSEMIKIILVGAEFQAKRKQEGFEERVITEYCTPDERATAVCSFGAGDSKSNCTRKILQGLAAKDENSYNEYIRKNKQSIAEMKQILSSIKSSNDGGNDSKYNDGIKLQVTRGSLVLLLILLVCYQMYQSKI